MPGARPRRLIALLILTGLAVLAANGRTTSAAQIAFGSKVAPDVRQALQQAPAVRVIVSLRSPADLAGRTPDIAAARQEIAAEQAPVLAGLSPSNFQLSYRYQAVPALAGRADGRALVALAEQPDVQQIAIDGTGDTSLAQSVPLIHADEVHTAGITGAGVIVAVLDSGIDTNHPDLADSIAYEKCFLAAGGCPAGPNVAQDDNGHGTNVSGIITGNGTVAPIGVAPGAQIAAYKVLDSSGSGFFSDWIAALDDIIANHPEVKVINMSLQSTYSCPGGALATAIATLRSQGVATFIASGNHGSKTSLTIPACITEGISVGAVYDSNVGSISGWKTSCVDNTTSADQVACWSDSGPTLDLLAPGARITAAGLGGGTSTYMGTSQAAPHAAGVAALLLQAVPGLTVDELENRMKLTGTMITDDLHDNDPSTNRQTPRIDARVALLSNGAADFDGDGCTNAQEFGPDPMQGGQRNPLNPWDYFNPTHDGKNRIDDVTIVIRQYRVDKYLPSPPNPPNTPNPAYRQDTDRTLIGPNPWNLGPPDGVQRIDDITAILHQYRHDCR